MSKRNMRIAIYPGSFDPVTLGHLDIIRRASGLFDRLIVAVMHNQNKKPMFSVEERMEMLRRTTAGLPNVEIESFGGLLAVNNVNLELYPQEIVSLIGPNGAGKTTVFNCLTGFYKPTGGTILLRDQHLEGVPGQQIARMGVVRTFQHVRLFREMTVIENLLVAQHQQLKTGLFSGLLKTPSFRRAQSEALDRAATWLERIGLLEHANRQASNLAYGDQRRLEIARCMVTQPEILMLDEPAAGLNPKETKELDELIAELRNHHNTTILLIEHDMKLVMGISDRIYVVNQGTPLANGTPEQIRNNPDVIRAYLGEA